MKTLDTLLFDLDGTLTDPAEGFTRCIAAALAKVGLPAASRERIESRIGPPLEDTFRNLGASPAQVQPLVDAYRDRYRETGIFENALYPGIREALSAIREQGYVVHLATSKPKVFAEIILDHFEIDCYFDEVFGSNLDGSLADKRELLEHAREKASIDPDRSAMIGDRRFDLEAADALGLFRVGVSWGYGSREELERAGAQLVIDRPDDLPSALAESTTLASTSGTT